ncbi:MAG: hypothetical protein ACKVLF_07030, partial [Nitrospinaceae bacterium]
MKRITGLALIMFSLFSISYLVKSVSAQNGTKSGMNPRMNPGYAPGQMLDDLKAYEVFDPFKKGHPSISSPGMAPGYAPGTTPGMAPG